MQDCPQSRDQQKHSLAAEVLRKSGHLRLAAMGQSMLPTLWPGDLLTVRRVQFDEVAVGDVVLFAREDRFFIHRVLGKHDSAGGSTGPSLVTRGDSMRAADAPVSPEELLGRVVSASRNHAADLAVPGASWFSQSVGFTLAHWDLLRRMVLRLHAWRSRDAAASSEFVAREIPQL
jgi:signal peptidase I